MKKITAIFLLLTYITAFCELHELLKLPFLLEHFSEHRAKNADMSIVDFFYIHYIDQLKKTDDFQDDMKLPFRQADCSGIAVISFEQPEIFSIESPPVQNQKFKTFYNSGFSSAYKFKIFQPPRFSA